jgi:NAD-dependent DNA ligase
VPSTGVSTEYTLIIVGNRKGAKANKQRLLEISFLAIRMILDMMPESVAVLHKIGIAS